MGRPGDGEALHLKEGVGPLGGEAWLVLATEDPVGQWEFDPGVVELLDCWSVALAGCDLLHLHDLDRVGPGTVPGAHVSVCRDQEGGTWGTSGHSIWSQQVLATKCVEPPNSL